VTALVGRWWRTSVVGMVPDHPAPDTLLSRLPHQLEWAIHMGIPAVVLPAIPSKDIMIEYAQKVNSLAVEAHSNNVQLWMKVNMAESALANFDTFHQLCDGAGNIGIMLVMEAMPNMHSAAASVASQIILLHKAIGANLKAICFPTKIFLTNKRGYPTLAKSHQVIFTEVLKRIGRTVRVMVEGPTLHDLTASGGASAAGATRSLPYLQYIRHMRQRPECKEALDSEEASMERAYLDSLQRPLQPLKDHLEFSMYETFEKDPVKYLKYQEAVYLALKDGLGPLGGAVAAAGPKLVTIAVVGAGRGPLVMRSIRAFQQLQAPAGTVTLKIFAVEKNPSAVVYLQSMARHNQDWAGTVSVIQADGRNLTRAMLDGHQIDIVVSELLGSFGDNELSPECLDPVLASPCCKPTTISIPMQYTSFLAPVSSVRLHTEAKQQSQVPHDGAQPLGIQRAMETSYVVRTHAASQTHSEQPCWVFSHPPRVVSKERAAHLEFAPDPTFAAAAGSGYGGVDAGIASIVGQAPAVSSGPVTLHGLLGSFTAILYARGDVVCDISIAPHRFSKDMFSWFPIYFPFREPLQVPAHCNVSVSMWRKTADGKVWYEWYAKVHRKGEIIDMTPIHNTNGRSSYVSM
jgi:protein arginine N-methyltransferase 5